MKQSLKSCIRKPYLFLKSHLMKVFVKAFAVANVFPARITDRRDLLSLLKKLYPLSTNKELIRLGPKSDGGYLVPNDLVGIQACFSPGVGPASGFEKDCAKLGMKVFLADKSVDRPPDEDPLFFFTKKFVGVTSDDDFMTLDHWVASSLSETNSDLLLQMDIEGYEYEVLLSASPALLQRFRIIVAEFHHLDQLWSRPFFSLARRAFDKLLQTHVCVHIHPNNYTYSLEKDRVTIPGAMEFTFLRIDRIETSSYQKSFPNPLDHDNATRGSDVTLPQSWYSQ